MKKYSRGLATTLLCILVAIAMLPITAFARSEVNTEAVASLDVTFPVSGMTARLYKVADMAVTSEMTLSGDFAGYPVSLEQEDQLGWNALAQTLAAYAARDNLAPLFVGSANPTGKVTIKDLTVGLYLVTSEKFSSGKYTYTVNPFLVALPSLDENETWFYDVSATVKYEREKEPDEPSYTNLRVHKVWDDSANTTKRPTSIQVELLMNGQVHDTVTLNAENGWSYEWNELNDSYTWQVTEKNVPTDYTVRMTKEGKTYLLTNTLKPDTPTPPDNPPKPPSLPQTGLLWWPVPVLAALGLLAILGGALLKRRSSDHEQ